MSSICANANPMQFRAPRPKGTQAPSVTAASVTANGPPTLEELGVDDGIERSAVGPHA